MSRWRPTTPLLVTSLLLGCPAPEPAPPPAPPACADGTRWDDATSSCAPVLPTSCPAGTMAAAGASTCQSVGWTDCPQGFAADPSGWGCLDLQPAGECPPGTMPKLGNSSCQPVGWTSCPAGFAPHPSGWGCIDVSSATACTGATREALGQTDCKPLGDCAATFPPAGAQLFVDDSYTPAQLDATHFKTVQAALDAAPDGALVAVEAGSYPESLTLSRKVTLVGRCAGQVVITGTFGGPGLGVTGRGVEVRGVTLQGHRPGALVQGGGTLLLIDALLSGNQRAGALATGKAASGPSQVELRSSAVRGTLFDSGGDGAGVLVQSGAKGVVTECALFGNAKAGALVVGNGSQLSVQRTLVRDCGDATQVSSAGLWADQGGLLEVGESAVSGTKRSDVLATGIGTRARVSGTVLRDPDAQGASDVGAVAYGGTIELTSCGIWDHDAVGALALDDGSALSITDSVIGDTHGTTSGGGIEIGGKNTLTLKSSAVVNVARAGLMAVGPGTATVLGSLVKGVREGSDGSGYQANAVLANAGAQLDMQDSAIVGGQGQGLAVSDASSKAMVQRTLVQDTRAGTKGETPIGILVSDHAVLELSESAVVRNASMGIAVGGKIPGLQPVPATARISRTVVRDTLWDPAWVDAAGLFASDGSQVTVTDGLFLRNGLTGVSVTAPGTFLGLAGVVVRQSVFQGSGFAYGVMAGDGAFVDMRASVVREISGIAVLANTKGKVSLDGSLVADMPVEAKVRGFESGLGGVAVLGSLAVTGSTFERCENVALIFDMAQGTVGSLSLFSHNATALSVQGGSALRLVGTVDAQPAPLEVQVADDSLFEGNATRTGSDAVPLPDFPTF